MILTFCFASGAAWADQEAPNIPQVADGDFGRCFAYSAPAARYGTKGRTDIYLVGDEIALSRSYDWYAPQMRIACNVSDGRGTIAPAIAQIGPWPRGHRADKETLAIAFYYDGALKAEYSTLDIANGDQANVSCSVSHYTVIKEIEGFERGVGGDETLFRLKTVDGRRLTFSAVAGALIRTKRVAPVTDSRGAYFR